MIIEDEQLTIDYWKKKFQGRKNFVMKIYVNPFVVVQAYTAAYLLNAELIQYEFKTGITKIKFKDIPK